MNRQTAPKHDVDNMAFQLEVFDATGVKIDPVASASCGDGDYFVVKTEKIPTFSVTNPFQEPVTAEVFFNRRKEVESTLQPGQTFRVLGDDVEPQIWDLKAPLWGQRVDVTFNLPVDTFRRDEALHNVQDALLDYLEALRSPRAKDEAQSFMEMLQEATPLIRSGHACFRFMNAEGWERFGQHHHGDIDRLLGSGSDFPMMPMGIMVEVLGPFPGGAEVPEGPMPDFMKKILRTEPDKTFQA